MSLEKGESSLELRFQVQKDTGQQTAKQDSHLEFKCRELGLGRHQQVSKKVNCSSHS